MPISPWYLRTKLREAPPLRGGSVYRRQPLSGSPRATEWEDPNSWHGSVNQPLSSNHLDGPHFLFKDLDKNQWFWSYGENKLGWTGRVSKWATDLAWIWMAQSMQVEDPTGRNEFWQAITGMAQAPRTMEEINICLIAASPRKNLQMPCAQDVFRGVICVYWGHTNIKYNPWDNCPCPNTRLFMAALDKASSLCPGTCPQLTALPPLSYFHKWSCK